MLDSFQEQQLTGGGDTLLHFHLADRTPTHETVVQGDIAAAAKNVPTDPYTVTESDLFLYCPNGETLTMPLSKANGREFEVVMTGTDPVTVNLSGSDTVYGETSVYIEIQGTALRFKAVSGGWVFI